MSVEQLLEARIQQRGLRRDIKKHWVHEVVHTHDQGQLSYPHLWPVYGKLLRVDFFEKRNDGTGGKWTTYNTYWWVAHASVISHDPDKLVEEHVKYFVQKRAPEN